MGPALWGRAARHLRVLSRPIALNGPTGSPVVDFRAPAAKITTKLAVRGLRGTLTTQAFAQEPRRRLKFNGGAHVCQATVRQSTRGHRTRKII